MSTYSDGEHLSRSEDETHALGVSFGGGLSGGEVLALIGDLGAGKTRFVRGLAEGIGADPGEVASPTYVLQHTYPGRLLLHHFDAYRLTGATEFIDLGADDCIAPDAVVAIEWADRVPEALPDDAIRIEFEVEGETERRIRIRR